MRTVIVSANGSATVALLLLLRRSSETKLNPKTNSQKATINHHLGYVIPFRCLVLPFCAAKYKKAPNQNNQILLIAKLAANVPPFGICFF